MTDQLDRHLDLLGEELGRGVARAELRRRRRARSAGIAAVLGVVGVGALVTSPGGQRLDPVSAARAAVTEGDGVLHYVVRTEFLGPGDAAPQPPRRAGAGAGQEVWMATSGDDRYRVRALGRPGSCGTQWFVRGIGRRARLTGPALTAPTETAQDGRTLTVYSPFSRAAVKTRLRSSRIAVGEERPYAAVPGFGADPRDPVRAIRAAVTSGQLQDRGTHMLNGREVRQLVGEAGPSLAEARRIRALPADAQRRWRDERRAAGQLLQPTRYRYLIDATRSTPVELRTERYGVWSRAGGWDHWKWTGDVQRFASFSRLADSPSTRAELVITPPAGTVIYRGSPAGGFIPRVTFAESMKDERIAMRRCRAAMR